MNAAMGMKSTLLASVLGLVVVLMWALSSSSVFADDAVDTIIAANVAKTTALAPLPKIISVPLPSPNAAQNHADATSNTTAKPVVDAGNGELLTLPSLNAPVIDQANVLSEVDNQQISDKLRAIHDAGRAQIGLVLVKSTQGEAIFEYAGRVFTAWKLGDAKRDNGLLIVVAVQDRKIQILTGYGLEGVIPDVIASGIIREQITPPFKSGQYAVGLSAGIDRIDAILQEDPETAKAAADQMKAQQSQQQSQGDVSGSLILLLIILVVIGQFTQMIFGRALNSGGLAAAGVGIGLFTGIGLAGSLLLGGAVFILLLVGVLPFLSMFLNGGGGGRGGGFGGGGYGGGGGSFGGGGASGSW